MKKIIGLSFYCLILIKLLINNENQVLANMFIIQEEEKIYYINVEIKQLDVSNCYINYLSFINNNVFKGQDTCFSSPYYIVTAGENSLFVLEKSESVKINAGMGIKMLAGTYIKSGAYLHAYISQDGIYCDENYDHFLKNNLLEISPENVNQDSLWHYDDNELFFKIYPNPSNRKIFIDLNNYDYNSFIEIGIYDLQGKLLEFKKVIGLHKVSIDLFDYQAGLYLLRVRNKNKVKVEKIVKF